MHTKTAVSTIASQGIEDRYKALFDRSPESIFLNDLDGYFIDANKAFLNLTGYTFTELMKLNINDLAETHKTDFWSSASVSVKQPYESGTAPLLKIRDKNGSILFLETSSSFIFDKGNPCAVQTIAHNITERIQQERTQNCLFRISESVNSTIDLQALFINIRRLIQELMPADNFYIALYDSFRNTLSFPYWTDEASTYPTEPVSLGRGLTEYVLRNGVDMLVDEDMSNRLIEQGEIELIGKPSKIWLGIALKQMDRTMGVMAVQDYHNKDTYGEKEKQILIFVSEQIALAIDKKRAEEELLRYTEELQYSRDMLEERAAEFVRLNEQLTASEEELKEINASKDRFFSIIAHDLRTPFSGLLGFSNLLLDDFERLSKEEIKNFTLHINSYTKNLYNLIENLLQWSRLQTGKMDYQPIRINFFEMVADSMNILIAAAAKKNISLINEVDENTIVSGDQNMLRSVIQNLITNAIKFTNADGRVTISSTDANDEFIEVSVKDNGVGIRKENLEKIFRIDTAHSTPGTAQEKGTGLGLILCKDLISKHGGSISVESQPGEGTTFRFTLRKFI